MHLCALYSCCRFSGVEEEFHDFAKNQHSSVEKIVDLVKENEEILNLMRVCSA